MTTAELAELDGLRFCIFLSAFVALVCWFVWAKRNSGWFYFIPLSLWLINVFNFQFTRLFIEGVDVRFLNNWSLALQLQATLTLALIGIVAAREHRKK